MELGEPVKVESAIDRADEFVARWSSGTPDRELWVWREQFSDQSEAWQRAFNGRVDWQLRNGKDR